jgi:hypothetical protein
MKKLYALFMFLTAYAVANAQTTLATWPFTSSSTAATGVATNVTASSASFTGSTPAFNGTSVYYADGGWPTANALDAGVYFQFSVGPSTGSCVLTLSSIDLYMRRSTTGGGSGPNSWCIRSSVDNYATNVASGTGLSTSAASPITVTLGSSFNTINGTVTFRVYGYNVTIGAGGSNRLVFESMNIKGTVYAVSAINFRNTATGNFADGAIWEYSTTGVTYISASTTPTATNITNIKSGTTVTAASDISIATGKNITVDGKLNLGSYRVTGAGNVIVNSTGTVQTSNTGGLATAFANTGTITLNSGASYIFDGATTTPFPTSVTSVNAKDLTASASVTLNKPTTVTGTLSLTGGTLSTNNNLTLASTASGTARIDALTGGATISGNITAQKYLPGGRRAYRFLAHPFTTSIGLSSLTNSIDITGSGGSTNGFTNTASNNPSAFWYNEATGNGSSTNDIGWTAFTNTNGVGSNAWKQYGGALILFRGAKGEGLTGNTYTPSAATISFNGTVNTGNQTITLTKGANTAYSFIGNPYPSQVDLAATVRGSNVGANFWVWDANQGTKGGYTSVPFSSSYILPAYSSIIVTTSANTNNTIQFTEACKSNGSAVNLFRSNVANAFTTSLQLRLQTDSIFWDRLLIGLNDKASSSYDRIDAEKLMNSDVNFYSLSSDGKSLSIDARDAAHADTIALGLQTTVARNFTIQVSNLSLPQGTSMYLYDAYLNTTTLLSDGVTYAFATNADAASKGEGRFQLIQRKQPVLIPVATTMGVKVMPNPATEKFVFTLGNNEIMNGVINLTNQQGQAVKSIAVVNTTNATVTVNDLSKGTYYVTYIGGSNKVTVPVQIQ